jgi:signal transduction histidine kinase
MAGNLNLPAIPLWRTIFVSGIMAIAVIIVIGFTVRRLTKPLRRLASAADSLGRGESVGKVDSSGPPEIRSAIGAFNTMQERLTRFIRDRTAMLAAVSHDLRTPITSLRIRAEFIEDEENRTRVIAALDEMQRMVEATLAFARDEAHREQPARVDLGEFLDAIVTDYQDVGKAVRFASEDKPGRIVISFSPIAIRRALRNLIDNALRYGNEANIDYRQVAGQVEITVSDTGPGIPEARLADMFEPFVRLEGSRSGDTGGIGLGLAIARSAIHAHGGTISLENRSEGGLVARVMLPR